MKSPRILAGGLTLAAALALCCSQQGGKNAPKGDTKGDTKSGKVGKGEHSHGKGPHGGAVADWGGGKYHVEFLVDHDKQEATVYVLGSDEKTPAPVKAKDGQLLLTITEPAFQVTLKAAPQKGDPEGSASCYTGKHEKLGNRQEFAGTISGVVDGANFVGDFKEEPDAPKKDKK